VQDVVIEVVGGAMGNGFITSQNQSEVTDISSSQHLY
jgi:hypothetical protein